MREIDTFIRLGKADHILTVLVEGEPEESFPPQLRFRVEDGQTVEKEPLAADVRAASLSASLKKLKQEKLRILAPMLGLNYDALKQRAKVRRQRVILGISAAALALVSAFSVYAVIQNKRIEKERDIAQSERVIAENERNIAETERSRAESERNRAETERNRAEKERD